MRRLIEGTTQAFSITNYILDRKDTFIRVLEKGDNDFLFGMLIDYFCEQPTAYDVDKVVEELKEYQRNYESGLGDFADELVDRVFRNVISIVKAGGIDDSQTQNLRHVPLRH